MKVYLFLMMALVAFIEADGQTEEADSLISYTSIGTTISSASNYYGQTVAEKLPFTSLDATYKHRSGWSINTTAYKLLEYNGLSELDASLGYEFDINKKINMGFGYSYFYYPDDSPLLQSAYNHAVYQVITYDFNIINAGISTSYAFGDEQDIFTSFSLSKEFELGSLFSDVDYIGFSPSADITAGTQKFYETYFINKKNKPLPVKDNPGQGANNGNNKLEEVTEVKTNFDVLSYNLYLPVSYNRAHYTLEFNCQLSALNDQANLSGQKIQPFFNLSFYYLFY